jgi:hypothetical protein
MAALRDLRLSEDQMDRWRNQHLTDASSPIAGSAERGYTAGQATRILQVAEIAARIPSKRPTVSEIAFILAYEGHAAPPLLVLEHIEKCMRIFQGRVRRMLDGHGDGTLSRIDASARLAPQVIRTVLRYVSPRLARNALLFEVAVAGVEILLNLILTGKASEKAFPMFASLIRRIFTNSTSEAPKMLWDLLHEAIAFLRLDEKNAIFLAVKDACSQPEGALLAATDTHRLLDLGSGVFPWMSDAGVLCALGWFTADDRRFFNRHFAPMVCGLLLALRKDEFAQRRLSDVRAGNVEDSLDDLKTMRAAGGDISVQFRQAFG